MKVMEGSEAIAEAVRLAHPSVVSAYPITPQTHIVESLAKAIARGELDAEFLTAESEHSAASMALGARSPQPRRRGFSTWPRSCSTSRACGCRS
jgi:pyruvate ferredoxin oxidoreductase alpha subunit